MPVTEKKLLFKGLKVLDVGTWIAGPVAATILADFGADVIKVEIPGEGDPYRKLPTHPGIPKAEVNYTWLLDARNKRSLTLNLKTEQGRDILKKMIKDCDIYVTNQPMPVRRKFGLTYEEVAPLNKKMIYASLTAYGEKGEEADKEGFDTFVYWIRSGLADLVRAPGAAPGGGVAGMGDHPTAVTLFASIMMALYRRQITGEGGMVSTSLLANGFWSNSCMGQAALSGADMSRHRARKVDHIPWFQNLFNTSDDRQIYFSMIRNIKDQERLIELLGCEDLLNDARFSDPDNRQKNNSELKKLLDAVINKESSSYWQTTLGKAGMATEKLAVVEDVIHDEQAKANNILVPSNDPEAVVPYIINHPLHVEGEVQVGPEKPPDVGENTDSILKGLGYKKEEIEKLRKDGVI